MMTGSVKRAGALRTQKVVLSVVGGVDEEGTDEQLDIACAPVRNSLLLRPPP